MYRSQLHFLTAACCLFLTLFQSPVRAQSPVWTNRHISTGDNSDRFYSVAPISGGFVSVGYTVNQGNYKDFLVVRTDGNGNQLWSRTDNGKGNGDDVAQFVAVDNANNIYVCGYSDGGNTQDNIFLAKYDLNGNLQWDTAWDNRTVSLDDYPSDMALDASGNILICGNTEPDNLAGSANYVTVKFAPNGSLLWESIYDRPGITGGKDEATALVLDAVGDVYVTGRSFNGTDDDMLTIKYYGANGTTAWAAPSVFNGTFGDDRGLDIAINPSGTAVAVTGRSDNGNDDDVRTIKYATSNGIPQWSRAYSGTTVQNDRGLLVLMDAADNVYVGGQTDMDLTTLTNYDFLLLKYNTTGTLLMTKTYNSPAIQNDIPASMVLDASGAICMAGYADFDPNITTVSNFLLAVIWNSAGTLTGQVFASGTNGSGNSDGSEVVVDPVTGNFVVAGTFENTDTQKDGALLSITSTGVTNWSYSYNYTGDFTSAVNGLASFPNGRAAAVGYSYQEGNERDALIKIMDNSGQTLCTYLFNGTGDGDDELADVAIDASGIVYAAGSTKGSGQKSNFLLVKFNPSFCDTVWTREYNYSVNQSDKAVGLVLDAQGNSYITGRSDQNANDTLDNNDIVTIKYSPAGTVLWTQRYNGTANLRDEPVRISLDGAGNVVVCGRTQQSTSLTDDIVVIKYNGATGAPVWGAAYVYGGSAGGNDRASDMVISSSNDIYISGLTQTGTGVATSDALVLKVSASGAAAGSFTYNGAGSGNDEAVAVAVDYQGNVVTAIKADGDVNPLTANYDYVTIKLDNSLQNQVWSAPKVYDGSVHSDDIPVGISLNAVGEMLVTGYSAVDTSGGRKDYDIVTLRYDSWGVQDWQSGYQGPASEDDEPTCILQSGTSIWIGGVSDSTVTIQSDGIVLRYDLATGLPENASRSSWSVFPNPASSAVQVELPEGSGQGRFELTDIMGRIVRFGTYGETRFNLDLSGLIPGNYNLTCCDSAVCLSKRIVVQ